MTSEEEDLMSETSECSEQGWSDDDMPIETGGDNEGSPFFMYDLVSEAFINFGDKINYKPDNGHLELNFDTSQMTLPVRQALGIADVEHIITELTFESSRFGAGMVPHLQLRFVKHEVPTPQKSIEPFIDLEPDTVDTESTNAPASLDADDQPSPPPDPLETSDSESDDDPLGSPKFKQQVVNTVAYQFANIAKKKLTDDWPETQNATWKQATEWIPQLHKYLETRLTKLGDYCVICDDVQPVSGIKPVACSKHLCSHQFDEMGFGASMDIIYNFPTVADLLISMAAAAASNPNKQHRQRFFACPNPPSDFVSGESARRDTITDLNETMGIKWENLQEVLTNLPAVSSMAAAKDLKAFLNKYHPHAYRLVRWVLSTCRGHIVELDETEQIHGMKGHQFKLFTNTFERELAFQKLKQQHQGSFYAFHGSPFMKWHSIMRTCLQNFSNTQYMTAGAAYGSGVYTARQASTSLAYSTMSYSIDGSGTGYKASIFGASAACLALVEVAGKEADAACCGIHVVKNHDGIVARYIFVYPNRKDLSLMMNIDSMKIPAWNA